MLKRDWLVATEKKRQTRSPISTHAGKLAMFTRSRTENTTVIINMYARGFRGAHRKPKSEFL